MMSIWCGSVTNCSRSSSVARISTRYASAVGSIHSQHADGLDIDNTLLLACAAR